MRNDTDVCLELIGGTVFYPVTDPMTHPFVSYMFTLDFGGDPQ